MVTVPRSLSLLILLPLAACGSDAAPPPAMTESRDSAGVTILTSSAPAWGEAEGWSVAAEPALTIGAVEGDPAHQLFRVGDVMRLGDGRIAVADGGSREVRLFDAEGAHLASLGGPGQGPEEYGYPAAIAPAEDGGFVVYDRMDRVLYDSAAGFLGRETFDRQGWAETIAPLGRSEGGRPMGDRTVLAPIYEAQDPADGPPKPGPPFRPQVTVARVDLESGRVDTLAHIGGILQQYVDVGDGRPRPIVGPFAPSGLFQVARDGGLVIWDGAVAEVHRVAADGTHRLMRWAAEPEPVTPDEIEAWKEQQRQASWARDQLPQLERGWAAIDMPTAKAPVAMARPSRDGSTWVLTTPRGDPGPAEWQIFDPDGAWLGAVELPGAFDPKDIGDGWVLGVHRDPATEIETVRLYEVRR